MPLELSKKALKIKPSSTMEITERVKTMKREGLDIVSLTAGEPDFQTPENICAEGIRAIREGLTKYTPASGLLELKEAVSEKFKRFNHLDYGTGQIVISNGGKHSLSNAFTAILNEGDEVIVPAPFWVTYTESARLAGGVPVIVYTTKENNYKLTVPELEKAYTEKTKALVLNTPNNPSGMMYSKKELEDIADFVIQHDFYVIADEVYESLCYDSNEHVSIASLNEEIYRRTITVSALSKSYAMTGWRIGYAGASPEVAKAMSSIQSQQTSNPNTIAQIAAIEALNGDQSKVAEMVSAYNERRKYICRRVNEIEDVSCAVPQGAFYVFVDLSALKTKTYQGQALGNAAEIARILLNDFHVAGIPCADFGFPDHLRLSYSVSMEEIEEGMNRIHRFRESLS